MNTRRMLCGSTLSELLVTMVVTGIVFLCVMEGFGLFQRLQLQRASALVVNSRLTEGYYRLEGLFAGADSLHGSEGRLVVWRAGGQTVLLLADSALIAQTGGFCDTLLAPVGLLQRTESAGVGPDTVTVEMRQGVPFTIRFPVLPPAERRYRLTIDSLERDYGYEK